MRDEEKGEEEKTDGKRRSWEPAKARVRSPMSRYSVAIVRSVGSGMESGRNLTPAAAQDPEMRQLTLRAWKSPEEMRPIVVP